MTTKVSIFPIKICARKSPEELEPIMSIVFVPEEDTFNKPETIPVIDINFLIETNKEEYIDYICSLEWFSTFYAHTNVHQLFKRVNFACNINVTDSIEFTEEMKEKLNAFFAVFVNKLKTLVDNLDKYLTLWQETPAFTITMGTEDEVAEAEHTHDHAHPHDHEHVHEEEEATPSPSEVVEDESKSE